MVIEYDLVTEVSETYFSDLKVSLFVFIPMLLIMIIFGKFLVNKGWNSKWRWLIKLWFYLLTANTLFLIIGMFVSYITMKADISTYTKWLNDQDYVVTEGQIRDIHRSPSGSIQTFIIDKHVFNIEYQPYFTDNYDIFEKSKTLKILHRQDDLILQIFVPGELKGSDTFSGNN